jgi:hypothetical protein
LSQLRIVARQLLNALASLPIGSTGAAGAAFDQLDKALAAPDEPIPIRLTCPECGRLHVDEGEWATRVHATHSCQFCGLTWRPAVVPTVGVRFLPGFKNEEKEATKP